MIWFNKEKGYGFARCDKLRDDCGNMKEIYVARSNLDDGDANLDGTQSIEFYVELGEKGPKALSIKVL